MDTATELEFLSLYSHLLDLEKLRSYLESKNVKHSTHEIYSAGKLPQKVIANLEDLVKGDFVELSFEAIPHLQAVKKQLIFLLKTDTVESNDKEQLRRATVRFAKRMLDLNDQDKWPELGELIFRSAFKPDEESKVFALNLLIDCAAVLSYAESKLMISNMLFAMLSSGNSNVKVLAIKATTTWLTTKNDDEGILEDFRAHIELCLTFLQGKLGPGELICDQLLELAQKVPEAFFSHVTALFANSKLNIRAVRTMRRLVEDHLSLSMLESPSSRAVGGSIDLILFFGLGRMDKSLDEILSLLVRVAQKKPEMLVKSFDSLMKLCIEILTRGTERQQLCAFDIISAIHEGSKLSMPMSSVMASFGQFLILELMIEGDKYPFALISLVELAEKYPQLVDAELESLLTIHMDQELPKSRTFFPPQLN